MDFLTLITNLTAPGTARRHVRDECAAHGVSQPMTETAVLLTSEIVTNAVLHGGGGIRLGTAAQPAHVRVEVIDRNAERPTLGTPTLMAESGRGVALVDSLADHWGAIDADAGKCVWFELDAPPVAALLPMAVPAGALAAHAAPAA